MHLNDPDASHTTTPEAGRGKPSRGAVQPIVVVMGLVIVALLAALLVTRSSDDSDTSTDGTSVSASGDAKKASDLVEEGLQLHVAGDLDGAAAKYREAVALDGENKLAHYNLALVDAAQKRSASAEKGYRAALEIDPDYGPALYNLAVLLSASGEDDEAITLYERAIEADAEFADAHFNLGLLLLKTGKTAAGNAEIAKAIELNPALASRLPGSTTTAP